MKWQVYLILLIFIAGCEKEQDSICTDSVTMNQLPCQNFITVSKTPCILISAVNSINGYETEKYVYHHNGTTYDKIEVYYRASNTNFTDVPNAIAYLTYEGEKIKEVLIKSPDKPETYRRNYFDYQNSEVVIGFELVTNNAVTYRTEYKQSYLIAPENKFYPDPQISNLWQGREYKDGNNVRVALNSENGPCILEGYKWEFTSKLSYDTNPNVFKDYAVRFAMGGETGWATQFWFANNKNNINVSANLAKDPIEFSQTCYTFLRRDEDIWIKTRNFRNSADDLISVTFNYSCE